MQMGTPSWQAAAWPCVLQMCGIAHQQVGDVSCIRLDSNRLARAFAGRMRRCARQALSTLCGAISPPTQLAVIGCAASPITAPAACVDTGGSSTHWLERISTGAAASTSGLWPASSSVLGRGLHTSAPLSSSDQTRKHDGQSEQAVSSDMVSAQELLKPHPLLKSLLHPIPLSRKRHHAIDHLTVEAGGALFVDPAKCLESVMRSLYVIKQVGPNSPDAHAATLACSCSSA